MKIFLGGFLIGLAAVVVTFLPGSVPIRVPLALFFVYFVTGYPLASFLVSGPERLIASAGLSLLLTYPAGLINVIREGQTAAAISGPHLGGAMVSLLVIYTLAGIVILRKKVNWHWPAITLLKPHWVVLFALIISVFYSFFNLGTADLNGDEYDLGYQAYDLVDGIFAGRKAYVLSFSAHPPLVMYIQHFTMQILEPRGLDYLADWEFRLAPAILGTAVVAVIYFLVLEITGKRLYALAASLLLAVSNYHVFLSRIFQREMFLEFFLVLFLFFFFKYLHSRSGNLLIMAAIFLGAAMLVKAVAIIFLPVALVFITGNRRLFMGIFLAIFSPVVIYNLGAYLLTGYTDIFFSRIFRTNAHPGASMMSRDFIASGQNIINLLADQYGIWLLLAFILGVVLLAIRKKTIETWLLLAMVLTTLLFFVYNGVRPYYLSFLTPFLVISLILAINNLHRRITTVIIFGILITYAGLYTFNTFFGIKVRVSESYAQAFPDWRSNFRRNYSLTARGFLEERGWKNLKRVLEEEYSGQDCLDFKVADHPLQIRRYLGLNDKIKESYLGTAYRPHYQRCPANFDGCDRWVIWTTDMEVKYERTCYQS